MKRLLVVIIIVIMIVIVTSAVSADGDCKMVPSDNGQGVIIVCHDMDGYPEQKHFTPDDAGPWAWVWYLGINN